MQAAFLQATSPTIYPPSFWKDDSQRPNRLSDEEGESSSAPRPTWGADRQQHRKTRAKIPLPRLRGEGVCFTRINAFADSYFTSSFSIHEPQFEFRKLTNHVTPDWLIGLPSLAALPLYFCRSKLTLDVHPLRRRPISNQSIHPDSALQFRHCPPHPISYGSF